MNKLYKISITRRFVIDAGHRIVGHEGKCLSVHGHCYVFFVTCEAPELDSIGRIIDFSVIKDRIGKWLDENWDHAMLLYVNDPIILLWNESGPLEEHKHFVLPYNPTIENLCSFLLEKTNALMAATEIKVVKVVGYETENCAGSAEL